MGKILEVNQLDKSFNHDQVLSGISFKFYSGKIYGLLGQNGSGKTTLMKCILGLNHSDSGSIIFDGFDIINGQNEMKRSGIGSLIEYPSFSNEMTVKKVLHNQLIMMNVEVDHNYLKRVITSLKLETKLNVKVKKLSLGWKQKLGIARSVYNYPKLLILDEPLNGLDPIAVQQVEILIKELANEGTCVIIASHILDELQYICDEMYLIKDTNMTYVDKEKFNNGDIKQFYLSQFE
ncbi:ABC transporter ATP-binding protein [Dellaglioa sp. L3N]